MSLLRRLAHSSKSGMPKKKERAGEVLRPRTQLKLRGQSKESSDTSKTPRNQLLRREEPASGVRELPLEGRPVPRNPQRRRE